jgi:hypothetical protein
MRFEEETVLENLSVHGLQLAAKRQFTPGTLLLFVVRFTLLAPVRAAGPGLIAQGVVIRTYQRIDGCYGLAAVFTRHRMLSRG